MAVFQVYPTATRALGLGTCSGMARVGALITPFIAQVGAIPNTGEVGMTKAIAVTICQVTIGSYYMPSLLQSPLYAVAYFSLITYLRRKEVLLADEKSEA